jgi:hypothetical protein
MAINPNPALAFAQNRQIQFYASSVNNEKNFRNRTTQNFLLFRLIGAVKRSIARSQVRIAHSPLPVVTKVFSLETYYFKPRIRSATAQKPPDELEHS